MPANRPVPTNPPRGRAPHELRDIRADQGPVRFAIAQAETALDAIGCERLALFRAHDRDLERVNESAVFDEALAAFALRYADQNERDEAFLGAISASWLETLAGSG